jgi:hypothetical protein
MAKAAKESFDEEIKALGEVLAALAPLGPVGRQFVLRTAAERIRADLGAQPLSVEEHHPAVNFVGKPQAGLQNPKQFLAQRRPVNDVQRIACLGYFLTHERLPPQPHFKTTDLSKLNTEAAQPKIGNAAQAVANATKISRYLAPAGGGKKQITPLGEEVVKALPDQEAVRRALQEHSTGQRKKPKKKSKANAKTNTKA